MICESLLYGEKSVFLPPSNSAFIKFVAYHMSKVEYTDYLIQKIAATGEEHALEVAAGTCICGRALAPYVKAPRQLPYPRPPSFPLFSRHVSSLQKVSQDCQNDGKKAL